jgi:hypothetical protein
MGERRASFRIVERTTKGAKRRERGRGFEQEARQREVGVQISRLRPSSEVPPLARRSCLAEEAVKHLVER